MPWAVRKKGDSFQVVKKGSGKVVGTHDTREAAQKQVSALYAKEDRKRA